MLTTSRSLAFEFKFRSLSTMPSCAINIFVSITTYTIKPFLFSSSDLLKIEMYQLFQSISSFSYMIFFNLTLILSNGIDRHLLSKTFWGKSIEGEQVGFSCKSKRHCCSSPIRPVLSAAAQSIGTSSSKRTFSSSFRNFSTTEKIKQYRTICIKLHA